MNRSILIIAALLCACGDASDTATPEPLYAVSDTTRLPGDTTTYAVLHRNGVVIDTIRAAFGAPRVGIDTVLYVKRNGEWTYYQGNDRTSRPVHDMVPGFDDARSAPAVINGAVLYWGLNSPGGVDSIAAVRYEFRRNRLNPIPIGARPERNPGGFTPPYLEGKEIVFHAADGEWRFRTPRQ